MQMPPNRPLSIALVFTLLLVLGCSHHHPAPKPTGSPEALATIDQLKGLNDTPASVSATYVFESHQPRRSRWAEMRFNGVAPATADAILQNPSPDYIVIRRVDQKEQGTRYVTSETRVEDGRQIHCEAPKLITFPSDPTDPGTMVFQSLIAGQFPFPRFSGHISTRHGTYAGEDCLIIRDEYPAMYTETYLSPRNGWLPRKIVTREIRPSTRPTTLPTTDQTFTLERQVHKWPFGTNTTSIKWTVPAAAFNEVDLNYRPYDSDTLITHWSTRPDGKWFITEATTTYPLYRKTIRYRVENLSFAPIPNSAFENTKSAH